MKLILNLYFIYIFFLFGVNKATNILNKEQEIVFRLIPILVFLVLLVKPKFVLILRKMKIIFPFIIFLSIASVFSITLYNNPINVLLGIIDFSLFIFILSVLVYYNLIYPNNHLISLITFVAFVQPAVCIWQFYITGKIGDHVGGLFGEFATNTLMFFQISYIVFYILRNDLLYRIKLKKIINLVWLFSPIPLGSSIAGFFILPLAIIIIIIITKKFSLKNIIKSSIVISILSVVLFVITINVFDEWRLSLFDYYNAYNYSTGDSEEGYGRIEAILQVSEKIIDPNIVIWGFGLGSTNISESTNSKGSFAIKYGTVFGRASLQLILLNFGIIGLIFFAFVTTKIFLFLHSNFYVNQVYVSTCVTIIILMVLFAWYSNIFFQGLSSIPLAFFLAKLYAEIEK